MGKLSVVIRRAGVLVTGTTGAALVLTCVSLLCARTLGATQFGVLAISTSIVFLASGILSFQVWQTITQFGTVLLSEGRVSELAIRVPACIRLEVFCGALAYGILAVVGGILAGLDIIGEPAYSTVLIIGLPILLPSAATSMAIMRLFEDYTTQAKIQLGAAVFKLCLSTAAAVYHPTVSSVAFAWAVADAGERIQTLSHARRRAAANSLIFTLVRGVSIRRDLGDAWFRFSILGNVHSTIKMLLRECDLIIVGSILAAADAGVYKIIKSIGSLAIRLISPLQLVAHPVLISAVRERRVGAIPKIVLLPGAMITFAGTVLLIAFEMWGKAALGNILGDSYPDLGLANTIFFAACLASAATFAVQPALLAIDAQRTSLLALTACAAVYFTLLPILTYRSGLQGAATSSLVFCITYPTLQLIILARLLNGRK